MVNTSIDEQQEARSHSFIRQQAGNALTSGEQALRRAISNQPGMALAISAAIGVLLACLIKRR